MLYALQPVNAIDFTVPWKEADAQMEANEARLDAENAAARKACTYLGRVVRFGVADGYAVYQITKVNKTTVRLTLCQGHGDDYVDHWIGGESTVPLAKIRRQLDR